MKKFIIFILCAVITACNTCVFANAAFTEALEIEGNIAYVVSTDENGSIIYDKNSSVRSNPGEIVKIVTGILVLENCENLKNQVTASSNAIRTIEALRVTTAGILVGETMTVEELLYCMLVYNANDASTVLAEYIGGTIEEFVVMMNDFAKKLDLKDTSFSNPGGYSDDGQYSTARELAVIFNYCMKNPLFVEIISTFLYEMPATNKYYEPRYLKNTNYLINSGISDYYFKYVKCGKSGYQDSGNSNCISLASKDGYNYICVILDAPMTDFDGDNVTENMSFVSSKNLYEWVFSNIKLRTVANTSTYVGEVKVRLSKDYDYVSLVPIENVSALVPSGVNAESVYIEALSELTCESVDAPVTKGDILGRAAIKYAGSTVAEVDLVAAFDVDVSTSKFIGDKIIKLITSPIFIILAIIIVAISIVLWIISYRNKQKNRLRKLRAVHSNKETK